MKKQKEIQTTEKTKRNEGKKNWKRVSQVRRKMKQQPRSEDEEEQR